ncbi:MAG: hypothetical protein COX06_03040 [Candidatus Zambryskibacteria bacterium CG22_combo_CG10-13_8_21_14_all_42_17]|uniref:Uncharacterized protein n=1 Tax=Candidatus Zambryskibacteria bacterium CG22_combo_CG10-13_8_21_14_all_42_17 TaxID=1975118 RepID=A0A2H0BD25_9BACT|nr:MAG: hypothetical protein COX06_03040 [Candidatus Zambryskibacteria bacterium CG22_combo_CG10-13_8_21_14_all_42_17]
MPPKEKKPSEGLNDSKATEEIVFLLGGLVLLGAITDAILNYIESLNAETFFRGAVLNYFYVYIWPIWKYLAFLVSALAVVGIIHNSRKITAINIEENKIFNPRHVTSLKDRHKIREAKNSKWDRIVKYANSDNPSDWRIAIIESDVMLKELLRAIGYEGESVGDILKSVDKEEFLTIEDAWEAHKIRNAVAHSGGDFRLNEHETKRTIALFEKVFKEFQLI